MFEIMESRYWYLATLLGVILFLIIFTSFFKIPSQEDFDLVKYDNSILFLDNFSEDPSRDWILVKDAFWNSEADNLILATTRPGDTGALWLKKSISGFFTVEFSYFVGKGNGGNGFVFMFYKDLDYDPGMGRFLGFACRPEQDKPCLKKDVPGYGVEWDSLYNNGYGLGDPSPSHIALIKDNVYFHLKYTNDTTTKDGRWHRAKLIVEEDKIRVIVDDKLQFQWIGKFNRTFSGAGFSASSMVHYDIHIIDDFKLYGNTIQVKGLEPGWTVIIQNETDSILNITVNEDMNDAIIDITDQKFPMKASFSIYDETNSLLYKSKIFNEIWGGDILTLRQI